ncbi:DUF4349 domain-containing protein [Candidatus Uhrbacteria bacterium]|jgi:hypothetical protein|nr:DUF4349 domain-containing protein [Candidatus Uhrbacteria bacterium]
MNTRTLIKWGAVVPLSVIGVIAIVIMLVNVVDDGFYATTSSSGIEFAASDSFYAEEAIFAPRAKTSLIADEAIAAEIENKVIKTGSLDLIVDSATESAALLQTLAEGHDGYVSNVSVREHDDGTHSGWITLRVPGDSFDTMLTEAKSLALVVEEESVSARDVTEDYIDISARLKTANAQEARYIEILSLAYTVEDVLNVENALGNIRSSIESLTGRLQYLDSQIDFSTITVSLSEEPVITIGGKEFRIGTTINQAGQTVVAVLQWLIEALFWVVIVGVGVGVPVGLIVFIGYKSFKRIRK